ncbi:hypothetical protein BU16DRAFT_582664 [Lophium mytilinum]|uniref:Zn(2)-C6 fungal-type domain-containing protein n=1 Tax=Lophium mytilinum TaxID=390894 RepID=A0A6A6QRV1_9PEZI|nr:hypothetical protein BU16DRAFT_582664 [Lophium mytilinum]
MGTNKRKRSTSNPAPKGKNARRVSSSTLSHAEHPDEATAQAAAAPLAKKKRNGPVATSCRSCIKARCRCTREYPTCNRCTTKHLDCHYDGITPSHAPQARSLDMHAQLELRAEPLAPGPSQRGSRAAEASTSGSGSTANTTNGQAPASNVEGSRNHIMQQMEVANETGATEAADRILANIQVIDDTTADNATIHEAPTALVPQMRQHVALENVGALEMVCELLWRLPRSMIVTPAALGWVFFLLEHNGVQVTAVERQIIERVGFTMGGLLDAFFRHGWLNSCVYEALYRKIRLRSLVFVKRVLMCFENETYRDIILIVQITADSRNGV